MEHPEQAEIDVAIDEDGDAGKLRALRVSFIGHQHRSWESPEDEVVAFGAADGVRSKNSADLEVSVVERVAAATIG